MRILLYEGRPMTREKIRKFKLLIKDQMADSWGRLRLYSDLALADKKPFDTIETIAEEERHIYDLWKELYDLIDSLPIANEKGE
jgi:hypothetical protein